MELKMLFDESFNGEMDVDYDDDDDDAADDDEEEYGNDDEDDDYLWQGMNREWKGRRGASICTEVKRSRNPEKFSLLTASFWSSLTTNAIIYPDNDDQR